MGYEGVKQYVKNVDIDRGFTKSTLLKLSQYTLGSYYAKFMIYNYKNRDFCEI